ncbi:NUDIX domain-containing protein [Nonomuraea sp. NPDC048916]|uniref:NUDIX domain-containing protein n=1 Tax=Nonomuraea sp. NPDC048916 TaxID=3154232 RepID=UPI0033C10A84
MPISPYLAGVRAKVGSDLLMLPSACGCVFDEAGRLLVARHGDIGLWAAPGGGVDPDERPEETVVRELREELGIDIAVRGLIGVYGGPEFRTVYPNGHQCGYMIAVYGCVLASGTPVPDGDEITEARWVTEQELPGLTMTPWSPRVLPDVFAWWRDQGR